MLWSWDTAHLSVARDRPGPFEIDVPEPPTHVQKGRGSWCFLQVPSIQERPELPVFPVPRRGSSGSRGANSPRMEIVSVMRRKIAVGMLGLALAGCAQSRSSLPVAASRGQPIGMEPVPSINDTINRGTGDPAIVQATLPDPKNPNWSGEFIPPHGPAGTPAGPQVAPPTRFKDLHRPPILRAVRPLRPPPSLRRPRVRRQPVPLDCSLAPACRPLPWIPRRLEHRPPRRYRLCLHSSP